MIAAIVPAAGSSTRMGEPKLLVQFEGQSLIERVVSALSSGKVERVVVIVPPADAPEGPDIANLARRAGAEVVVPAARPAQMRDSIEVGLATLARGEPPRSVLLTPADYPGLSSRIVETIVRQAARQPDQIVIPTYDGRRGHPIILPWTLAVEISGLPPGTGVNALVARYAEKVSEIPMPGSAVLADLDTPADLENWRLRPTARFRVGVRLFALAKERAGCAEHEIELDPGSRVAELRVALGDQIPALRPLLQTALIAVNEEYADDETPIAPGSRLAVIPPVSGGGLRGAANAAAFHARFSLDQGSFPR